MTDLTPNHPSLEEVRRHWGLAVDIHRRDERLAEFDRMIHNIQAEAWVEGMLDHMGRRRGTMSPKTISIIRERIADANPYQKGDDA